MFFAIFSVLIVIDSLNGVFIEGCVWFIVSIFFLIVVFMFNFLLFCSGGFVFGFE